MKKIIIAIAMSVWVADVTLLTYGECFLGIIGIVSYNSADVSGIIRVNSSMSTVFRPAILICKP